MTDRPASPDPDTAPAGVETPAGPDFATTLRVRDACLCLQVQRAARALARRFDDAFRPVGLTSGQFSLLMALNRPDPPTMGQVAATLAMDRTTLTANLKPLEKQGLLTVVPDAADRRVRRLVLTEAGRTALRRALPAWEATQAALHATLGDADADSLCRALGLLT
ncbi:MAG: MarR family transcriptional regulator [Rhodospirillales bacterium 69-11]|nr:winged helix-turn-helix transcriptional regulator [Rhodospirillales bacterium]MBN8927223.1 winged helix-turn-helix transcriptional regulator [Rhodospirillales bacterium]OJW25634.1 MAG: MarR family transcriptional regulator [Rhodospirillales bacterium 69-11]